MEVEGRHTGDGLARDESVHPAPMEWLVMRERTTVDSMSTFPKQTGRLLLCHTSPRSSEPQLGLVSTRPEEAFGGTAYLQPCSAHLANALP